MEKNNKKNEFEEIDRVCWEEPNNHAIVKEIWRGMEVYEIYTLYPVLMMKLCDDLEYAIKLTNKMIENGLKYLMDLMNLISGISLRRRFDF